MAESSGGGRWAAEAFDFLRLHGRVRNQVYGLILWQLVWAVLVAWLATIVPGGAAGSVDVPLPLACLVVAGAPCLSWHAVVLPRFWIIGALLLTAIWLVVSRLSLFATRPLETLVRALCMWALLVVGSVVLLVVGPSERPLAWLYARRRARFAGAGVNPAAPRGVRERWIDAWRRGALDPRAPANAVVACFGGSAARFAPPIRIAIAPIESFSFEEEQLAARVPAQLIVDADARLRGAFAGSRLIAAARIELLPSAIRVASPQRARRLRRLLSYDAVLWGTLTRSAPPSVFLNVELGAVHGPEDDESFARSWGPLAGSDTPLPRSVLLETSGSFDAVVALLLALRHAVAVRAAPRAALRALLPLDPVRDSARHLEARMTDFTLGLLGRGWPPVAWPPDDPVPAVVLIDEAMRWGKEALWAHEHGLSRLDDTVPLPAIGDIIDRCLALAPRHPDLHYLAALFALLGPEPNEGAARLHVAEGWRRDRPSRWRSRHYLMALVEMAMGDADSAYGDRRQVCSAKAALYAAIALQMDAEAAASLRDKLKESLRMQAVAEGLWKPEELTAGERYLLRLAAS